jgi:DnaJ like chaperone protein
MSWMGKIIGGTIGFALGGPLGAVAGAVFGHAFDKGGEEYYVEGPEQLSSIEANQFTIFVAVFSMLAKLAKADGYISKQELDSIENFMDFDLNLDPQSKRVAINIFQTALDSPESFENFASQFYDHFRFQSQILEFMIDVLMKVSVSDGQLSQVEDHLIRSAASIFRLSDADFRKIRSRYVKETDKYYAVLGVQPTDSNEEIKKHYRKLVMEYHPDTIASKGLPEEFIKFSNDKFREIQEAFEAIKKERGIN